MPATSASEFQPEPGTVIPELGYSWTDLRKRLEEELRFNPLDMENPPNPLQPKQGKDAPPPQMVWTTRFDVSEKNPEGKNSISLLNAIKAWEKDLPDIVLLVHGGNAHPLQLIQSTGAERAEFLKSRPRFDHTYFDGQRDPAEGWMTAWNAWRYPTFKTGPVVPVTFTFKPPHTLFIDATLQALNDADLIPAGDRTIYEQIVDAVTHQPVSKQAAIKGDDGIFYWDLSTKPKKDPMGLIAGAEKKRR